MSHTVDNSPFWLPANEPKLASNTAPGGIATGLLECEQCGSDLVVGSKFCHSCGSSRGATPKAQAGMEWKRALRSSGSMLASGMNRTRAALNLPTPALVAFAMGSICVLTALLVGFMYSASTPLEWEAVQAWRLEWMLGAIAAFLAGILLRSSKA